VKEEQAAEALRNTKPPQKSEEERAREEKSRADYLARVRKREARATTTSSAVSLPVKQQAEDYHDNYYLDAVAELERMFEEERDDSCDTDNCDHCGNQRHDNQCDY
jgi:hypothetical protein